MSKENRIWTHYKSKVHKLHYSDWMYEWYPEDTIPFNEDKVILELARHYKMKCREIKDIIRAKQEDNKKPYARIISSLNEIQTFLNNGRGVRMLHQIVQYLAENDITAAQRVWNKHQAKLLPYGIHNRVWSILWRELPISSRSFLTSSII